MDPLPRRASHPPYSYRTHSPGAECRLSSVVTSCSPFLLPQLRLLEGGSFWTPIGGGSLYFHTP